MVSTGSTITDCYIWKSENNLGLRYSLVKEGMGTVVLGFGFISTHHKGANQCLPPPPPLYMIVAGVVIIVSQSNSSPSSLNDATICNDSNDESVFDLQRKRVENGCNVVYDSTCSLSPSLPLSPSIGGPVV